MKWSIKEEEIVVKFYLSHIDFWQDNLDEVVNELHAAGFISRDKNSTKMRVQNIQYIHTNGKTGLSNYSRQSKAIYIRIKGE